MIENSKTNSKRKFILAMVFALCALVGIANGSISGGDLRGIASVVLGVFSDPALMIAE